MTEQTSNVCRLYQRSKAQRNGASTEIDLIREDEDVVTVGIKSIMTIAWANDFLADLAWGASYIGGGAPAAPAAYAARLLCVQNPPLFGTPPLARFTELFPKRRGYRLLGAVAGLEISADVEKYAWRQGLFVLRVSSNDLVEWINSEQFTSKDSGHAT